MARLVSVGEVDVDPTLEDPREMADYVVDDACADPVVALVVAEWASPDDIVQVGGRLIGGR